MPLIKSTPVSCAGPTGLDNAIPQVPVPHLCVIPFAGPPGIASIEIVWGSHGVRRISLLSQDAFMANLDPADNAADAVSHASTHDFTHLPRHDSTRTSPQQSPQRPFCFADAAEQEFWQRWLDAWLAGEPWADQVPIDWEGSCLPPFTVGVLQATCRIERGQVRTYGWIAQQVTGIPQTRSLAARAVGNALRRNPIALLIPCHRVVPATGRGVGQYSAGGPRVKEWLLVHEKTVSS